MLSLSKLVITGLGLLCLLPSIKLTAQTWNITNPTKAQMATHHMPRIYTLFELDEAAMLTQLKDAPKENTDDPFLSVKLPLPDQQIIETNVALSPIVEKELAEQFPSIQTFTAKDNEGGYGRFDFTKKGFHAMFFLHNGKTLFIDPIEIKEKRYYLVYYKKDLPAKDVPPCQADHTLEKEAFQKSGILKNNESNPIDGLKTYRIAIAATGEYTQFHGGTKEDAISAITTSLNRVNGIFEKELSMRMMLVGNNAAVVYTNPLNDPYTNGSLALMIEQNHDNLNDIIGIPNYDVGHLFATGGGGGAHLRSGCRSSFKGRGATGLPNPTGDAFDIDYFAHELGHQWGGTHTFNGEAGFCGGNRYQNSAFEPGSGTTLMSYQGLCYPANVGDGKENYYHSNTLLRILQYTTTGSGADCAVLIPNNNNAPVANAGDNYKIPIGTPFMLSGIGIDEDGDSLSYCWEEIDLGTETAMGNSMDFLSPMFRSYGLSNTPDRIFPKMERLLDNNLMDVSETLPMIQRSLRFRLTVRDNLATGIGGGVGFDETLIRVVGNTLPFEITSNNNNWTVGSSQLISWQVGNTNQAPINAKKVNILLSTDGGTTFPHVLANQTDNDGNQLIVVPNIASSDARIKIVPTDNIFFALSPNPIIIQTTTDPVISIGTTQNAWSICTNSSLTFFTNIDMINLAEIVSIEAIDLTDDFTISFDQNGITNSQSIATTIAIGNLVGYGKQSFVIRVFTETGLEKTWRINFNIPPPIVETSQLFWPLEASSSIELTTSFLWSDFQDAEYILEIASDANFNDVLINKEISVNKTDVSILQNGTYYWRVTSLNDCGWSTQSDVSIFNINNPTTYCFQTGGTQDEWIDQVVIGPINHLSGDNGGYLFVENTPIDFEKEVQYQLSLLPGFTNQNFQEYWRIWVDLNQNGVFEQSTEMLYDSGQSSAYTTFGNLEIPPTALNGTTRLRVAMKYNNAPTLCSDYSYGEIEDYLINIVSCQPSITESSTEEQILNFGLGGFSNYSGDDSGQTDYRPMGTALIKGETYHWNVEIKNPLNNFLYLRAWIDSDQNGSLDSNECIIDETTNLSSLIGTLILDASLPSGKSDLLIALSTAPITDVCNSVTEVEWYELWIMDTLPDVDTDGIVNWSDNCPSSFNPTQSDSNNNGIGDHCDGHEVQLKVFLEGTFNAENQSMNNSLMSNGLLPLLHPFGIPPYFYEDDTPVSSLPSNAVDWMLIEARTGTPQVGIGDKGTVLIEQKTAILLQDGSIVDANGGALIFDNLVTDTSYYFIIRHRNHLDIVTATSIVAQETMIYDFTTAVNKAYGPLQQKMVGGYACMFTGDFDGNGSIQSTDFDHWKSAPAVVNTYSKTDANLDGIIQITDYDYWFWNKAKLGITEIQF